MKQVHHFNNPKHEARKIANQLLLIAFKKQDMTPALLHELDTETFLCLLEILRREQKLTEVSLKFYYFLCVLPARLCVILLAILLFKEPSLWILYLILLVGFGATFQYPTEYQVIEGMRYS